MIQKCTRLGGWGGRGRASGMYWFTITPFFPVGLETSLFFVFSEQIKSRYGASTSRREVMRQKGGEVGGQTGSSDPGPAWLCTAFQTPTQAQLVWRLCRACVWRGHVSCLSPHSLRGVVQSMNSRVTETCVQIPAPSLITATHLTSLSFNL